MDVAPSLVPQDLPAPTQAQTRGSLVWSLRARLALVGVVVAVLLGACSSSEPASPEVPTQGEELYQQNCASCHGADLSGEPDWKTPNPDGSYPPPPHDSSGHTWHHPDRVLTEIIRDGSDFPQSRMPAFGDQLSDAEIEAILDFIKASWGAEEREYQQLVTGQDGARLP